MPMKASISCLRDKREIYFIAEPVGGSIDAEDIGAQLAPMSVVEGKISPYPYYCMLITIFI